MGIVSVRVSSRQPCAYRFTTRGILSIIFRFDDASVIRDWTTPAFVPDRFRLRPHAGAKLNEKRRPQPPFQRAMSLFGAYAFRRSPVNNAMKPTASNAIEPGSGSTIATASR
jgi:hypothetical protein